MPTELQSLDTLFNSRLFRIPDYQRGYAWGERQLDDFWRDLSRIRESRKHYTGQLTIEKVPDAEWKKWTEESWLIEGKGFKPYFVVDGQQRLTTAIILIKCLLTTVPDGHQLAFTEKADWVKKYLLQMAGGVSRAYLFGYDKDNPSYEYLKTEILGEPSNNYQGTTTTYTANLPTLVTISKESWQHFLIRSQRLFSRVLRRSLSLAYTNLKTSWTSSSCSRR